MRSVPTATMMKMPTNRYESCDGQPSWVLHDPVRNLFFRIDWLSFELISHWALADPEAILSAVASGTTLRPQPDDLQSVQAFLVENQLLVPDGENGSAALAERCRKQRSSWWRWLLPLWPRGPGLTLASGWITSRCMKSSTMIIPVPL